MYNRITLIGNLVNAPERRQAGDHTVASFRLAVNERQSKETLFIDVEAWNKTAEVCLEYLDKGRMVIVEGRLAIDEWEKDGNRRSKPKVVANNVTFMPGGRENDSSDRDEPRREPAVAQKSTLPDYGLDDDNIPF